jgi:hypothetical protein
MATGLARAALAALLVLAPAGSARSQGMDTMLPAPAEAPLDFLAWIDRDESWLRDALGSLGVTGGYALGGGVAEARTVEALKALNRIRSFAHLAAPGLRPPFLDLTVAPPGGPPVRCATLFPRSVAPAVGPLDFAAPAASAEGGDADALARCRVDAGKGAAWAGLDRAALADRYFDDAGDLRVEFMDLNADPAFIAALFDRGYFVTQGDLTGRLRIDR